MCANRILIELIKLASKSFPPRFYVVFFVKSSHELETISIRFLHHYKEPGFQCRHIAGNRTSSSDFQWLKLCLISTLSKPFKNEVLRLTNLYYRLYQVRKNKVG